MALHKKLNTRFLELLDSLGLSEPKTNQKEIISSIRSGADVCSVMEQENGQTTAMLVGLIDKLKFAVNDVPRALIISADKERIDFLLEQIKTLSAHTDLRCFGVYPGPNIQDLKHKIYVGSDIVIGTSKRLGELYSQSGLNLNDLQVLVIDRAELCFRTDFIGQIQRLSQIRPKVQRLVFANSFTDHVERFVDEEMINPEILNFE